MRLVVHVDGGSRGNPGPAAAAAVLSTPDGTVVDEATETLGEATNNVAEYRGLLLGLRRAQELGATEVEIVNDSELVAKQLTGLYKVANGQVLLGGRNVTGLTPSKIASLGIARTFQNIRLFGLMTAEENVKVAMHSHLHSGIFRTILRTPGQRREERVAHEEALGLLDFVGIGRSSDEYARNLSYGDQRRLEVARALALKPKVLLLSV